VEEEKEGSQERAEAQGEQELEAAEAPEKPAVSQPIPPEPVKPGLVSRVKNWLLIALLVLVISGALFLYLWRAGVKDLKNDNTFLIVVQEKGVAKAGSMYVLSDDKAYIINVEELPAVSNLKVFSEEAECKWQRERRQDLIEELRKIHGVEEPSCNQILRHRRVIDRVIVVSVGTISELSTEPVLEYRGHEIPSADLGGYLTGSYWDVELAGNDPPWMFRANLLSRWLELYDQKIMEASYGSQVYRRIFSDYRSGDIRVHPWNPALLILRYIPLEQIFL